MPQRTEIKLPGTAPAISHYTDAVRFGDLLYISGLVSIDENNNVVAPSDVVRQTETIFQIMGKILAQAGGGFADVLKVNIYLTDVKNRALINPVREKYFGRTRPASTLVQVGALVFPELLVEIEAVAGLPPA